MNVTLAELSYQQPFLTVTLPLTALLALFATGRRTRLLRRVTISCGSVHSYDGACRSYSGPAADQDFK